jgi:acyl carrier protein
MIDLERAGCSASRAEIAEAVLSSLQEVLNISQHASVDAGDVGLDTPLLGRGAVLDSMGLVTLIVDLEQRLEEDKDVYVVLADERAMSQRRSPFRTVGTLTDYICQLIEEQE